jgi:hypothetical protein
MSQNPFTFAPVLKLSWLFEEVLDIHGLIHQTENYIPDGLELTYEFQI